MTTSTVQKIKAGHYTGPRGTVRNVYSCSGAAHTRNRGAQWLVTPASGKPSYFVPTLARGREAIC